METAARQEGPGLPGAEFLPPLHRVPLWSVKPVRSLQRVGNQKSQTLGSDHLLERAASCLGRDCGTPTRLVV